MQQSCEEGVPKEAGLIYFLFKGLLTLVPLVQAFCAYSPYHISSNILERNSRRREKIKFNSRGNVCVEKTAIFHVERCDFECTF